MDDKDTAMALACAARLWQSDTASRELGMSYSVVAPGAVDIAMRVTSSMVNGHGNCHGGYLFTLADSAFAFASNGGNEVTVAAGASIEFLRPVREGDELVAQARERRRGRRSGVYDVTVCNQHGDIVALFRGRAMSTGKPILSDTESIEK